ncbi:hypothetical protein PG985_001411 [Apiospora marii]|uniref:Secreted protein n=1 Tax=Apiospora marii TaxID=335849 RepID=A0ABR1RHT9_9PEZI
MVILLVLLTFVVISRTAAVSVEGFVEDDMVNVVEIGGCVGQERLRGTLDFPGPDVLVIEPLRLLAIVVVFIVFIMVDVLGLAIPVVIAHVLQDFNDATDLVDGAQRRFIIIVVIIPVREFVVTKVRGVCRHFHIFVFVEELPLVVIWCRRGRIGLCGVSPVPHALLVLRLVFDTIEADEDVLSADTLDILESPEEIDIQRTIEVRFTISRCVELPFELAIPGIEVGGSWAVLIWPVSQLSEVVAEASLRQQNNGSPGLLQGRQPVLALHGLGEELARRVEPLYNPPEAVDVADESLASLLVGMGSQIDVVGRDMWVDLDAQSVHDADELQVLIRAGTLLGERRRARHEDVGMANYSRLMNTGDHAVGHGQTRWWLNELAIRESHQAVQQGPAWAVRLEQQEELREWSQEPPGWQEP